MRGKKAKLLRREAERRTVGLSFVATRKLYKQLKGRRGNEHHA